MQQERDKTLTAGAGETSTFLTGLWVAAAFAGGDTDGGAPATSMADVSVPTSTTLASTTTTSTMAESSIAPPASASGTTAPSTTPALGVAPAFARGALESIDVSPTASVPPYERDDYQPGGWGDTDGDCQNDRHEVLIAESLDEVTLDDSGCFVETGRWVDPYTGDEFTPADEVTIDHVVPLSEAHRVGAWRWDLATKQRLASDLDAAGTLVVVGARTNGEKSASGPADWRPPERSAWCAYSIDWIATKTRWGLDAVDDDELRALSEMLDTCGIDGEPRSDQTDEIPLPARVVTSTATTSTTTTIVPAGEARPRLVVCRRRAEEVVIANDGGQALDAGGLLLHDEGAKHSFPIPRGTLIEPGATLTITTGDDPATGPNHIHWKSQNVWNNDGDTAYLLGPDVDLSLRCT